MDIKKRLGRLKYHPLIQVLGRNKGNPRTLVLIEPLWGIPYNLIAPFATLYMYTQGVTDVQIGTILSITMVIQVFFAFFAGILTDKLGRKFTTMMGDFFGWTLACLVWSVSNNFWLFLAAAVLNFMSKINPQITFMGMSKLLKSIMKWVLGITVTVFSVFLTVQSSATSLFDGVLFKATKYIIGNSVPIVGGFLSGGFDLLTAAGLLIKNSVGVCGIVLLIAQAASPLILLIAFSRLLKVVGAVVQAAGENELYSLFSDLSSDTEYFIAGLLTVAFMYLLIIMLVINSANSFI